MIRIERDGPPLTRIAETAGDRMQRQIVRLMTTVRAEGKAALRGYVATRLTTRAAYLITDRSYDEGLTAYFHSRWIRRRRGSAPPELGVVTRGRGRGLIGADVLAMHARPGGTVIRPVEATRLIVSPARGRARAQVARQLRQFGAGRSARRGAALAIFASPRAPGNLVAVWRSDRRLLATLPRSVRIPQRLSVEEMARILRRVLSDARRREVRV